MITPATLSDVSFYYPFGNTPPVCLTQDLSPEQCADILLLGCGDARNVLFTCFADKSRKIDVTCCDIEPGVHARNILLYSLIHDVSNVQIEQIWNIYYHWRLDEQSRELLERQTDKLLEISKSIEDWHGSVYGSFVRFCNTQSLTSVRKYWEGFTSKNLPTSEAERRLRIMNSAIVRAKASREEKGFGRGCIEMTGYRNAAPADSESLLLAFNEVSKRWWEKGTTQSENMSMSKAQFLNPALLYTQNAILTLHYALSPLYGFPLSTAFSAISPKSKFYLKRKTVDSDYLVECAKIHFTQWAFAFKKAVKNKLVIRIMTADAIAFALTLRSVQVIEPRQKCANLFESGCSSNALEINSSDYEDRTNSPPLMFDVIDTSNLVDHLGPLNVFPICSSLLKNNVSSTLYTELLVSRDSSAYDRMSSLFGVDARSLSLLLGLVPLELYTNATHCFEPDSAESEFSKLFQGRGPTNVTTQLRSRLSWRRFQTCRFDSRYSPYVHVEASDLARLLVHVHDAMFIHENPLLLMKCFSLTRPEAVEKEMSKHCITQYNRASFALLTNVLRTTVITDWDKCIDCVYEKIMACFPIGSVKSCHMQELFLSMHLFGVDNGTFHKPTAAEMEGAVLLPILPSEENLADQLCVTIKVSRKELEYCTKNSALKGAADLAIELSIQSTDLPFFNCFASVQVAFGVWREHNSGPFIEQDVMMLSGTSDMYVSAFVPSWLLLSFKRSTPLVTCRIISTPIRASVFVEDLGLGLCIARREMTSSDVFITKYMPGTTGLPALPCIHASPDSSFLNKLTVCITNDKPIVSKLVQHVEVESKETKTLLAIKSSPVKLDFESPLTAIFTVAHSHQLTIEFPVPISPSKFQPRIARKSSYVEIAAPLFDPLTDENGLFMFPTYLSKVSPGVMFPMSWTCQRINLDVMPVINVGERNSLKWLNLHVTYMFSNRERRIRTTDLADVRSELKDSLHCMFSQYSCLQGPRADIFGLRKPDGKIQTLFFPSSLRLDLLNQTVVLDVAVIPLTSSITRDPKVAQFFLEISMHGIALSQIQVSKEENRAWKILTPVLVERCRSWNHSDNCDYSKTGKVPLLEGMRTDDVSTICSCGVGIFPSQDYLSGLTKKLSTLRYMIKQYGTRAAIAPIFPVPYVEDCFLKDISSDEMLSLMMNKCANCNRLDRKNSQIGEEKLLRCARCRVVLYCSTECQRAHWKKHKVDCLRV